jgi:2-oxoglutarate dehydrogenase E2 component (dihydrolipoamide succinyltransferase)
LVIDEDFKIVSTPPFAESVSEGDVKWIKSVGDFVNEDDIIVEIETDKVNLHLYQKYNTISNIMLSW